MARARHNDVPGQTSRILDASVARLAARNTLVLSGHARIPDPRPVAPEPPSAGGSPPLGTVATFPAPPAPSVIVCAMIRQKRRPGLHSGLGIELPFTKRKDRLEASAAARVRALARANKRARALYEAHHRAGKIGAGRGTQTLNRISVLRRSEIYSGSSLPLVIAALLRLHERDQDELSVTEACIH